MCSGGRLGCVQEDDLDCSGGRLEDIQEDNDLDLFRRKS